LEKTLRVAFLRWHSARPPQGRALARQAARLGKQMAGLEPAACGGCKDVSAAGAAGRAVPEDLREAWDERVAIMVADGGVPRAEAARLAGAALQAQWGARCTAALYG